jgi:precorrin-4 methylase
VNRLLIAAALALGLGACSTQVANNVISAANTYDAAVQNFKAAAAAIDGSIALTSQTVGPYCQAAQAAGQNLVKLASGNATVTTALNTTAAALDTYCIALPTDIQGAIVALTGAAVAAKTAAQGG